MSTAVPTFDPYREWLGIEPHEQPADFYRLLGIARFETDVGRIAAAADQRMALVRSFQTGPRVIYTQRLLNELSAARIALLSPPSKAAYDAALAQHLAARISPRAQATEPSAPAGPAVLTFGLGQTAIPPAPPVLPPPPPAAPRVSLQVDSGEEFPPEPMRPAPWWRPLVVVMGVPLFVLAAVVGWGVSRTYLENATVNPAGENAEPVSGEAPARQPPPKLSPKRIVLLQEGSGEVVFSPATAKLAGAVELSVAGTAEVLTGWSTADDSAEWQFKVVKPGFFQVEIVYATIPEASGAGLELLIDDRTTTVELRSSGGLDQFLTDTETLLVSSTAEQPLLVRPVRQPAGEWLVLRSVRFIPPDRAEPAANEAAPP